jgi:ATP-dependent phosphoenolpyruvate carboxykinase
MFIHYFLGTERKLCGTDAGVCSCNATFSTGTMVKEVRFRTMNLKII